MLNSGDTFQAENLGKFLAVLTMKDGSEIHIGVDDFDEAERICKEAVKEDPNVARAVSATRNIGHGEIS